MKLYFKFSYKQWIFT